MNFVRYNIIILTLLIVVSQSESNDHHDRNSEASIDKENTASCPIRRFQELFLNFVSSLEDKSSTKTILLEISSEKPKFDVKTKIPLGIPQDLALQITNHFLNALASESDNILEPVGNMIKFWVRKFTTLKTSTGEKKVPFIIHPSTKKDKCNSDEKYCKSCHNDSKRSRKQNGIKQNGSTENKQEKSQKEDSKKNEKNKFRTNSEKNYLKEIFEKLRKFFEEKDLNKILEKLSKIADKKNLNKILEKLGRIFEKEDFDEILEKLSRIGDKIF